MSRILETFLHAADHLGIDGFILDPWNEVEHKRDPGMTETEYISHCLSVMREFARVKKVCVWVVAHPAKMRRNQDGSYPIPSMWDISGSAAWRAKADVGLIAHRPDIKENTFDLHIQKVRFKTTGHPGSIRFAYNFKTGVFTPKQEI